MPVAADTISWAAKNVVGPKDEVVLVTVVDNALRQQLTTGAGRTVPNTNGLTCEADPETLEYSQKFLAKIKEEILAKEGVKATQVQTETLVSCVGNSHDIGKVISEYASDKGINSVVVGARGLGAFKRTMLGLLGLGSVSQYVVAHAPCNVIVHKMEQ
ncbi:hypothetical protein N2152v2_003581 [Parachlorella kessleri]